MLLALSKFSIYYLKQLLKLPRHLSIIFFSKTIFFMVMCICVRGPTLARLAMILVLLSIGNTPALRVIMFQTGGKPSTWFPPVRLVELYVHQNLKFSRFQKSDCFLLIIRKFKFFSKNCSKMTPSRKFGDRWKSQ